MDPETAPTPPAELSMDDALAAAFLSGVEDEVAVQPTADAPAAPEAQPAAAEKEAPPAPTFTPREYKFTRNGKEETFTPSSEEELVEYLRKGYDYTAKTMEVAEQKKQLQGIAQQLYEKWQAQQESVKTLLTNRELLARYIQNLEGQGGQPASPTPTQDDEIEPVSQADFKKQLAAMREQALKEAKEAAKEEFQTMLNEVTQERLTEEFSTDLSKTVDELVSASEELKLLGPAVKDLIWQAGNKAFLAHMQLNGPDNPVDPRIVRSAMTEYARDRVAAVRASLGSRDKASAVEKAALVARGIEPAGGNAPTITPSTKTPKLGSKDLDDQVLKEVLSIMGQGAS